ncbi:Gfo/Idh/MocA family oxidoreductase [uncultured Rubinisphaera sp.]|uniref:Gfo/Idh/MocA family protein n=1 Tax=uncultured Rubinisphaera sp. TaxID=1678686 RepID=UPI0030DD1F98
MYFTPEEKILGTDNFHTAVGSTRRDFLIGTVAAGTAAGATYFGYQKLDGNPVKVGFIGTGDEGSVLLTEHPPEYMEIVAIADLRPTNQKRAFDGDGNEHRVGLVKKLGANAKKNIKVYPDHRKLLEDPNIEAVVIAVPLNQHAPIAIDALNAGKHVLCEKLMAHDITQCKQMIKAAKDNNKLLAVGHQRHYSVLYDNANHIVQQGLLGDIKFIRAQWHRNNSFPGRDSWRKQINKTDATALEGRVTEFGYDDMEHLVNWRLYNKTGGGLMAELGSHQLDAASIFLGKVHPIAVQGYGGRNFYGVKGVGSLDKQQDDREIDDHVYVTFEFPGPNYESDKNDKVIVTYSSINTNRMEPYGESVFGSRGTMYVNLEKEALLFKEASPTTGGGGTEQRLHVLNGNPGGPVLDASESLAPSTNAAVASAALEKISRGYTEEMEHFCYCIRNNNFDPPSEGGLKCNGTVAMADAIMALTSNLAMKHQKRIVFKDEWFDPTNPATPENDEQVTG